jgi:hypothetical protein
MDTKGKNIARPVHRPQVDALSLVVPVSRKRAEGHNGHNGKLSLGKTQTNFWKHGQRLKTLQKRTTTHKTITNSQEKPHSPQSTQSSQSKDF